MGLPFAQRVSPGLDDLLGRVKVRLSDTQGNNIIHGGRDVKEATNARGGHLVHALGYEFADLGHRFALLVVMG